MRRFSVLIVGSFLLLGAGCGGGGEPAQTAGGGHEAPAGDAVKVPDTPAREAIPEALPVAAETEGVAIYPSFAIDSTVTDLAVAPNTPFEIYVHVTYPEPWHMMSLQYRLALPAGVRILGEQKFEARALTMGDVQQGFSMAFGCRDPGTFYIMKYICVAEESFSGGTIETTAGVMPNGETLIGFASCETDQPGIVHSRGGSVTLIRK